MTSTGVLHGPHSEPVNAITRTKYVSPANRFDTTADVDVGAAPCCHDTPPFGDVCTRYDSTNAASNGAVHDTVADVEPGVATTFDTANGSPSVVTSIGSLHGPHSEPVNAITRTKYVSPANRFDTTADVDVGAAPCCHDTPPFGDVCTRYDSTNAASNGAVHDTAADVEPGVATTFDTANGSASVVTSIGSLHGPHSEPVNAITRTKYV